MKKLIFITLLIFVFLFCVKAAAEPLPRYNLAVSFDIEKNLLKGTAKIILPEGLGANVHLGALSVTSIKMNGRSLSLSSMAEEIQANGTLEISYECVFRKAGQGGAFDNVGAAPGSVIGGQGISLTDGWYPVLDGLAYYSLKAVLPDEFKAVSEADDISVRKTHAGLEHVFSFPYPLDGINLVAAKYEVCKETFDGIDIFAYFFPEDVSLSETYIEHTKEYLRMYGELLGPYPFRRFSVVENFLPTGYSMPTFTLLGRTVVRLPFIVKTSLGHEVLHQWFGNYVYADYDKGNWIEGLTSYLADHFYDERKGEGWKHRKKFLLDYRNYINADNEISLGEFVRRTDFAARSIGYGKGAMVFHMLKNHVGEDIFHTALRSLIEEKRFQRVSWDDLREAFEKASCLDLEWFFKQWLTEKGIPSIVVEDPRVIMLKGAPTVVFRIVQKGKPYRFSLPVKVVTDRGGFTKMLNVEKKEELFEFPVEGIPRELIIDGGYDMMRKITNDECPPVISGLLGDNNRLVVEPVDDPDKYKALIELLKSEGFKAINEREIKDRDIETSSLLVFGTGGSLLNRLYGRSQQPSDSEPESGVALTVRKNPLNTSKVVAVAYGSSKEEVDLFSRKIFRYGKYSRLKFRGGRNVYKETSDSDQGIRSSLYKPVFGVRPEKTLRLEEIISGIIDKPIIYVGEGHTLYEDHKVQLEVIHSLYESGRKFAIGMEMFQRPFQQSLDDYISGVTNEREFLKSSGYFKRWKFNYHLYREILEFAREKDIPVVALNQETEIIKKVSMGGLDALTDEERKKVPADMDMSDEAYKKRLSETFQMHGKAMGRKLNNFCQAQILWDETMAHSVEEFLRENPDYQMVVIAGAGHIAYGSGIPKRVYRLNAKEYVTLLNVKAGTPIVGLADFVLFPEPLSPPGFPPVLGITIDKNLGRLIIDKVLKGGLADKSGLKKGDRLLYIDDMEVFEVDDVFISLFDKKQGDTLNIKVLRKRFFLPDKRVEFSIEFP